MHSRRIVYYRDRDEDDKLVFRDARGWWVARVIFERATEITT